jgi:alpha-1,4-digalacturonate transport system permease protein
VRLLDCENYLDRSTCRDDLFWTAVWNTARFVVLQVTLMTSVAMVTALILNREMRARGFWRAVFFFPVLLSPVVVGLIWRWILQREGLLNWLVDALGGETVNWLTERSYAFAAAVGVSVWAHMGFYALILLAGLQAIPRDLYEAASIDGAGPLQRFLSITLPFLAPTIAITILLRTVWISNFADLIIVMTNGGPADRTQIVASYIFTQAFKRLDFGYASAIALVLLALLLAYSLLIVILRQWLLSKD